MSRDATWERTNGVVISTWSKAGGRDEGLAVSSVKLVRLWLFAGDSQKRTLIGRPAVAAAAVSVTWRCRIWLPADQLRRVLHRHHIHHHHRHHHHDKHVNYKIKGASQSQTRLYSSTSLTHCQPPGAVSRHNFSRDVSAWTLFEIYVLCFTPIASYSIVKCSCSPRTLWHFNHTRL